MSHRRFAPLLAAAGALALVPASADAAGPTLFQHGGRAMGQAGALVARSIDPTAVSYNPAAAARLDGQQLTLGLDFSAPRDDFESRDEAFAADHVIIFTPAFYWTWHMPEDRQPFTVGLGFDSKAWHLEDWFPALFPSRFVTRRQELRLWDVHPIVAYEFDESWSIGGGLHYYFGTLGQGENRTLRFAAEGFPESIPVEVERLAEADVDGFAADLALHYTRELWGWGLVLDSGGEVEGNGRASYEPRDVHPLVAGEVAARFGTDGDTRQAFDLPWELRTGWWIAFSPEVRVELDLAYTGWSVVEETSVVYRPDPVASTAESTETRRRDWDDTLSARLGLEGNVGEHWLVSGGIAWEPSPVPDETLEPGFSRGDTLVYSLGFSYELRQVSFDVGYSFHDIDDRDVRFVGAGVPRDSAIFSSRNQVFGASASWRW
jgi:long-chain fatty acid transport protein